jgi:hypothetical protein
MAQVARQEEMLSRTQLLMAVVSLTPLVVLFWIAQRYISETLRQSGQFGALYSLSAVLIFTAIAVVLGYVLVRRDTLRAIEAIGEGERRLDQLFDATGRIAALRDSETVRIALVESAADLCRAQRAALWMVERDSLRVVCALGMSEERAAAQPVAVGHGLVGTCAAEQTVLCGATLSESDVGWDDRVLTRTSSSLLIPLEANGEVIAVLDLRNIEGGGQFGAVEQQLAEGLVRQATLFLDNAAAREASKSFEEAVAQLVEDITDTHLTWPGHVAAVQDLSERIACRLGLPESRRATLKLAARVHDIGLIDFQDTTIGPPGGHVDHAIQGAQRIQGMSLWAAAAVTVRASHEQMDGRGPQEMHSFAIPMSARILALAEYVDTVTNPASPWGKLSVRDVIAEITAENDERFDTQVIAAFIEEHEATEDPSAAEPMDLEDFEDVYAPGDLAEVSDVDEIGAPIEIAEDLYSREDPEENEENEENP